MTPDKHQISELAELLSMAHAKRLTNEETAELLIKTLMPAIATALRTARNEALEEAASECDDWIQSGPPMSACAKALASEIRALKIVGDSNDA